MLKRFRVDGGTLGCSPRRSSPRRRPRQRRPTATICGRAARAFRAGSGGPGGGAAPSGGGAQTYLYYIQLKQSRPSENVWLPYDEAATKTIGEDFPAALSTNFLDNLWIDATDYTFPNGVIGKIISYNMEERQRVKIVEYVGSKKIETSKIDEKLKDANAQIRLDTFIDPGLVRKVSGIVRDMLKEKGFRDAEVTPEIKEIPGGPKLVNLTFHMDEGPNVKIRKLEFVGNTSISSRKLKRQMKENKQLWFLSHQWPRHLPGNEVRRRRRAGDRVLPGSRVHQGRRRRAGDQGRRRFGGQEDAVRRAPHSDHRGPRYEVGSFDVAGNTVVKSEFLKPLFKLTPGEYYSLKNVRKGLDKAREIYGGGGYWEFTGFPGLQVQRRRERAGARGPRGAGGDDALAVDRQGHRGRDDADSGRPAVFRQPHHVRGQQHDPRQRHPSRDCAWSRTASSTPSRSSTASSASISSAISSRSKAARTSTSRRPPARPTRSTSG